MKNIQCAIGFHRYTKWRHIGMANKYQERLKRRCRRCGKVEYTYKDSNNVNCCLN